MYYLLFKVNESTVPWVWGVRGESICLLIRKWLGGLGGTEYHLRLDVLLESHASAMASMR